MRARPFGRMSDGSFMHTNMKIFRLFLARIILLVQRHTRNDSLRITMKGIVPMVVGALCERVDVQRHAEPAHEVNQHARSAEEREEDEGDAHGNGIYAEIGADAAAYACDDPVA